MSNLVMKIPDASNVVFEVTNVVTNTTVDVPFLTLVDTYNAGGAQVAALQAQLNDANAARSALEEQAANLQAEVTALQAQLNTSQGMFASLVNGIKSLLGITP